MAQRPGRVTVHQLHVNPVNEQRTPPESLERSRRTRKGVVPLFRTGFAKKGYDPFSSHALRQRVQRSDGRHDDADSNGEPGRRAGPEKGMFVNAGSLRQELSKCNNEEAGNSERELRA